MRYGISDCNETPPTGHEYRRRIVDLARSQLGAMSMRYVTGRPDIGRSPETGFDCSGFVSFILTQAGLSIPDYIGQDGMVRPIRHANEFWDHYGVAVHPAYSSSGDLIVFSRHGRLPTHVGIMTGADSYIHAPGRDKTSVEELPVTERDIPKQSARGQPLYAQDPIGYKAPTVPLASPTYRYHQTLI